MTDQMRQKLERLRAVAPRLNETTNEAARVVQAVEKFLAGLSLGISVDRYLSNRPAEARPDVEPDEDRAREAIETRLAYGKFAGSFRFFVRETLIRQSPYDPDRWDDVEVLNEQAWSSCTREVKLAAFAELPALLDQIVTKAEKLANGADEAARTVGELLAALGYADPSTPGPRPSQVGPRALTDLYLVGWNSIPDSEIQDHLRTYYGQGSWGSGPAQHSRDACLMHSDCRRVLICNSSTALAVVVSDDGDGLGFGISDDPADWPDLYD